MSDLPEFPTAQPPSVVMARPVSWPPVAAAPPPMELPGVSRPAAVVDLVAFALIALFVPLGFELIAAGSGDDPQALLSSPLLIVRKWIEVAVAAVLLTYALLRHGLPPAAVGLRADRPWRQVLWAAVNVASIYAYMFLSMLVILPFVLSSPEMEGDLMKRTELLEMMPVNDIVQTVLLLVPVAVHEEILFRGLLIPYLRRLTGRWWIAIVLSAAIFGVLHLTQGVLGAIQITGVGVLLGVFFVRTRSLLTVALAHFAFDFLQFQLVRLYLHFEPWLRAATQPAGS